MDAVAAAVKGTGSIVSLDRSMAVPDSARASRRGAAAASAGAGGQRGGAAAGIAAIGGQPQGPGVAMQGHDKPLTSVIER